MDKKTQAKEVCIAAAIVFAVALLGHISALHNSFVMDDFRVIQENEYANEWNSFKTLITPQNILTAAYPVKTGARPLTLLSLVIDNSVYKESRLGLHLTNILLHSVNSVLIFYLALVLFKRTRGLNFSDTGALNSAETGSERFKTLLYAVFAGIIFAVHPLQAEAANVASFRGDMLACLFYVLSLVITFKALEGRKALYAVLPFTLILGLLAKEIMVSFPLAFLFIIAFFGRKETLKARLTVALGLGMLAVVFFGAFWAHKFSYPIHSVVFTSIIGNISPLSSITAYINTVLITVLHYARVLTIPFWLSTEYQIALPGTVLNARSILALLIIASGVYAFITVKSGSVKAGLGLFFIAYLPVSNIVPLPNIITDRYMYIPMIGFALTVSAVLRDTRGAEDLKPLAALMVIFMFLTGTFVRNPDFRDMFGVYSSAVKAAPGNARVRFNLGLAYVERKDFRNALNEFSQAAALNVFFKKDTVLTYIGLCHENLGEFEYAKKYYLEAVLVHPDSRAYKGLANIAWKEKDYEGAKHYLFLNLEIVQDADSYNNLGTLFAKQKNYIKAAEYYRKAVHLQSDYLEGWLNLMDAYELTGNIKMLKNAKEEMARLYGKNGWAIPGRTLYAN